MSNKNFELEVITLGADNTFRPTPKYAHKGITYIAAKENNTFRLKFKNNTASRVMVIPTIDGISVLNGLTVEENSTGYVINGYSSTDFDGWRISNQNVHDFVFSKKEKSYTANQPGNNGNTENCGVIGILVFAEKTIPSAPINEYSLGLSFPRVIIVPQWTPPPTRYWWEEPNLLLWQSPVWYAGISNGNYGTSTYTYGTGNATSNYYASTTLQASDPSVSSDPSNNLQSGDVPKFALGTSWGNQHVSPVYDTIFEKGSLREAITLYYAAPEDLTAIGVELRKGVVGVSLPQAFPSGRYCQPPATKH